MKLRHWLSGLVMLAAMTPEATAYAEDPPPKAEDLPKRQATYVWDKNDKTGQTLWKTTFSYRDIVDKNINDKLLSGIPQTIVMRAYVQREGDKTPVALAGHTCSVKYQLWEDVFSITLDETKQSAAVNVAGVLRQCAEVHDLVVADRALLTGNKPFFLGVLVEVNPISPQMLDQMKQWVSRPAGSTGIGPGDALFGSFVGLFVKQIGNADKTLRFRTQSVTPP